jgi:hypothetical protein
MNWFNMLYYSMIDFGSRKRKNWFISTVIDQSIAKDLVELDMLYYSMAELDQLIAIDRVRLGPFIAIGRENFTMSNSTSS